MEHCKFAEKISSQYSGLLDHLYRKVRNRDLAADLMHHAVAITLEKARCGDLTDDVPLAGYVFRVSINLWRNHRRSMHNRVDCRASTEVLMDLAGPDGSPGDERLDRLIHTVLESLGARDRTIISRFYLAEDDKQAICDDLGLSSSHFDLIVSRARRRLREKLEVVGNALLI